MATITQRRRMYQNMTVVEILRSMSDAELDRNARRGGKGAIQEQAYRRSGATTIREASSPADRIMPDSPLDIGV